MKKMKEMVSDIKTGVKNRTRTGAGEIRKSLVTLKDRAVANMEAFLKARRNQ